MKSTMRYEGWTFGRSLTVVIGALAVLLLSGLVRIGWAQDTPAYTVLYTFALGGPNGSTPAAGLIRDKSGNLYGTAPSGGAQECGVVFKLDPFGHETPLYSFACGTDGGNPQAGVILDPAGNLCGTTYSGGDNSCGGAAEQCSSWIRRVSRLSCTVLQAARTEQIRKPV